MAVLQPAAWDSLAKLTGLTVVASGLCFDDLPRLARLPASVEALTLHVAARAVGGGVVWHDEEGNAIGLDAVLDVATRAPGVRALRVWAPAARLRHSRALVRAAAAAAQLRVLEVVVPSLQLHDIGALAMLPGLMRLAVSLVPGLGEDDPGLQSLVSQRAAEGLQIAFDVDEAESVVKPAEQDW